MESCVGSYAMVMCHMNPKMISHKCSNSPRPQLQLSYRVSSSAQLMVFNKECLKRLQLQNQLESFESLQCASSSISGQCAESPTQSSQYFEDFHVSVSTIEDRVIKVGVNVGSAMMDSTFEKVFSKHVAAAQPLPGFRQVKGGKTPDIPKDVLLHLVGPSRVKKETIKKIINCTIAEYVQKEGLNASKNLKVQQSYEELEAAFEPGKEFCFDAVIHLQ